MIATLHGSHEVTHGARRALRTHNPIVGRKERVSDTPIVAVAVIVEDSMPWLPYALAAIAGQTDIQRPRVHVVVDDAHATDQVHAAVRAMRSVWSPSGHLDVHTRPEGDARPFAMELLAESSLPYGVLTSAGDYWTTARKLARQVADLRLSPSSAASAHPVVLRSADDCRVVPRPEWRRAGTFTSADAIRAIQWGSLLVRRTVLRDAEPSDVDGDFAGLRRRIAAAGVSYAPEPMVIRQLSAGRPFLDDHPADRVAATCGSDWTGALESALVLPVELERQGRVSAARDATLRDTTEAFANYRRRVDDDLAVLEERLRDADVRLRAALRERDRFSAEVRAMADSRSWRWTRWMRRGPR